MLGGVLKNLRKRSICVVEEATESDLNNLAEIHREGFARGWSDGELAKLVANENYACFVARKKAGADKPPLAFILVRSVGLEAEIITLATRKSSRRQGAARQLIDATIRQLEADRVASFFLEVDENNKAAIDLYKKLGFRKVGERKGYYTAQDRENPSTALVMQRDLG